MEKVGPRKANMISLQTGINKTHLNFSDSEEEHGLIEIYFAKLDVYHYSEFKNCHNGFTLV